MMGLLAKNSNVKRNRTKPKNKHLASSTCLITIGDRIKISIVVHFLSCISLYRASLDYTTHALSHPSVLSSKQIHFYLVFQWHSFRLIYSCYFCYFSLFSLQITKSKSRGANISSLNCRTSSGGSASTTAGRDP